MRSDVSHHPCRPRETRVAEMRLTPQFITPAGTERLVILPETQFRMLERMAAAHLGAGAPDAALSILPKDVKEKIAAGGNPVRAIREWRGMTAKQLAQLVEITPSMLSQIERTGKTGSTRTFKRIAAVLGVPLDAVVARMEG